MTYDAANTVDANNDFRTHLLQSVSQLLFFHSPDIASFHRLTFYRRHHFVFQPVQRFAVVAAINNIAAGVLLKKIQQRRRAHRLAGVGADGGPVQGAE